MVRSAMTSSIVISPPPSPSLDPESSLSPVEAHALWNRFRSALEAKIGKRAAKKVLATSGLPAGSLRAIPVCLDRVCMPGWRFRSFFEAEASAMDDVFEPVPVRQSTQARPGSAQKLAVLRERAERGEDLWHPDDAHHFATPGERSARSPFYALHTGRPLRETLIEDLIDLADKGVA